MITKVELLIFHYDTEAVTINQMLCETLFEHDEEIDLDMKLSYVAQSKDEPYFLYFWKIERN